MNNLVSTGRVSSDISNVVEVDRTPASRAQFDPQPGDTMTSVPTGNVYTVTRTTDLDVHCTVKRRDGTEGDRFWTRREWALPCDGDFVFDRPGAVVGAP